MDEKVIESILEITRKRDSDEFGLSIITTIAQIIPNSLIALFNVGDFHSIHFKVAATLCAQKDSAGIKQYVWDIELPDNTINHIEKHFVQLTKMTVYQTDDGKYHTFIPIIIENKVTYALDIASSERFSDQLDQILAITRVCQNFYAVLASSEKDSLTGLFNRRTYEHKLNTLLKKQYAEQRKNLKRLNEARASSEQKYTWLAIIDIDHFKRVNDRFGHIYGDEVLLVLSQLMQKAFRQNDLLFRFGGEEFVIIVEPIGKQQVEHVLNKFKEIVSEYRFPMVGQITISCGFAKVSEEDHPKTIFDNADKALYFAKENGRNAVYSFETLIAENKLEIYAEEGDIELF